MIFFVRAAASRKRQGGRWRANHFFTTEWHQVDLDEGQHDMIERDPHLEITNEIPDSYINGAHVSDSSFPDRKTKNQLLLENDPEDGEEEEEKDEEEIDEANPVEKILKKTSRKKVAASSKPIEVKEKANNEPESDSDKSEDPDDILKDL